ncbi:MAG: YHS domain-containing protein, partial [Proteobacteria bacterium]|nr:YHS domain-containing protein [Pseudomonadota bacterium]
MKDPVCGMNVDENSKHHSQHESKDYYFCSEKCLDKFAVDPSQYIKKDCCGHCDSPEDKEQNKSASEDSPEAVERSDPEGRVLDNMLSSEAALHTDVQAGKRDSLYTCPMHPEVEHIGPGSCPKCGMALESKGIPVVATKTQYTCPMHPEIIQDEPGNCPICGMTLESMTVEVDEENHELTDMSRRFKYSAILAFPVFVIAMIVELIPAWIPEGISMKTILWTEFILATPVVLWGGWPFYVRAVQSVINRSLNMFTLIGLGVSVAWAYSVVALLFPGIFPAAMRGVEGTIPVYFEAAAVITALILLGQVLE